MHTHYSLQVLCLKTFISKFYALAYIYMYPTCYILNILFKTCLYTISCIILSYMYFKISLQKFPTSKNLPVVCFRQVRPTDRSTGACVRTCTVCACLSVDRPVDPTVNSLLSGCLGRPPSRPPEGNCGLTKRSVDPAVDRSPTALCQQGDGRPARSTAKPAEAQRLFPLWCNSENCFYFLF